MFFVDASNDSVHIGGSGTNYVANIHSSTINSPDGALFVNAALNNSGKGVFIDGNSRSINESTERLLQVRDRSAYNAFIVQVDGRSIFNDDGSSWQDFRVESDNQSHMLFVDASLDAVLINTTAKHFSSKVTIGTNGTDGMAVRQDAGGGYCYLSTGFSNLGTYYHVLFRAGATDVGSIRSSATTTSYNTSSDYRLKENVVAMTGATDRLKQLKPSRFNFITDPDKTVDGFLAHEAQTVVPEAVHGTHNDVDDEGNPVYQGIDQSKLVPLLVATIKELEARITALENA